MTEKEFLNLENVDLKNHRQRINSPRSIEAIQRLGIDINELYFRDFNTFRNENQEIKILPREIQILRYEHSENCRKEIVLKAIAERNNVRSELNNKAFLNTSKSESNDIKSLYSQNRSKSVDFFSNNKKESQAIELEKKAIEKIKERQKKEINQLIDKEILMEITKKENADKMFKQKEREEKHKNDLLMKHKYQEEIKKKREMDKEIMMKKELEDNERNKQEQLLIEQRKIQNDIEKEKQKKLEKMKKDAIQKQKQEEFKMQSEKNFFMNQTKIRERQKLMMEREQNRKRSMDHKKEEMLQFNQQIQELQQKKLLITKINLEEKINQQKEEFEKKQRLNSEKRKKHEALRESLIKIQIQDSVKKSEEINRILEKNRENEELKKKEYFLKQDQLQKQKSAIEQMIQEEIKTRQHIEQMREKKIQKVLIVNEMHENHKKKEILNKLDFKQDNIKKKHEIQERNLMFKQEIEILKRDEKKKIINRLWKVDEFKRTKKIHNLMAKTQKIDEFKELKKGILQKRMELSNEVSKKKQEILEKFDKMMKRNKGISVEMIKELFPDDKILIEKVTAFKTCGNQLTSFNEPQTVNGSTDYEKQNNIYKNTSLRDSPIKLYKSEDDDNYNQLKSNFQLENEIQIEIERYRQSLQSELLKVIQEEKEKEEEREAFYNKITDQEDKKKTEIIINIERSESSRRIVSIKQEIAMKLREYEIELRNK